ncbi:MAG: HAMP domain-containing histidine kinase [Anaerolineae bacterium]|nr:HAMP domain-containing histidine kinase [Anaerolineae bacterium]
MHKLRTRLILSHILPLLVVLPIIGVVLTYLLETQVLLAGLANELERQALLVAELADNYPLIWTDPFQAQEFATRVDPYISAQMTLITADGLLLATTNPEEQPNIGRAITVPGFAEVLRTGAILRIDYGEQRGTGAADILVPVILSNRVIGVIRLTDPLSSLYERFPRARTLIFSVLAVGLLIGLAVGLYLAFDLERPITRSTEAIVRMTQGQRLEQLAEQGPSEYRLLVRAFNALSTQLQSLEKARLRLLANLVHEIGRPLGALRSAIQALAAGATEDTTLREELLNGMEAEVTRMRHLLDDLTQLYGQALGPLELDRSPTAISLWLNQTLSPWREAALGKDLRWEVLLAPNLPTLAIDPDRLAQALGNIVSNAIKYTPPGGTITISAVVSADTLQIAVQDSGPGIASEEQLRIFEPFYRGPTSRRFPQGMGLGLTIARDLITAHNGRIEVESMPGNGSCFRILLPL